jgi:ABC-type spermidine/putrescine transport system permease subunit I
VREWYGWELALPAGVFLVLTLVIPLALLVPFGFRDVQVHQGVITSSQFTLSYLTAVLGDSHTYSLFWRSFWVACCVTALCVLFGLPVAYLYSVAPASVRAIILVVVIAPMLTSAIVRTYAWLVILGGRNGLVNGLLLALGWIDRPLRIINTPWAVLIGLTQLHLPFMILPLISVLSGRERLLDQASLNLGASRVATFFRVVLPMAVPGIGAGSAIVFSFSYTTFVPPQLLGGGNYSNAATTVYEDIVPLLDWGRGGVMALLLLVTCLACLSGMAIGVGRACRWLERGRS